MALLLDTSRALRTTGELRSLVAAIRDAPEHEPELDWLEWKGAVDLSERRWRNEISRQILGLANRDPAQAATSVEGCGYLVLGVEPQTLHGVGPIDPAVLEDTVRQYVGDGPRWRHEYVEVDGKQVLVATVEAPRWGDPLFPLEREYSFELNGRQVHEEAGKIFVRRRGKTERASPAEIRMLSERARQATSRILVQVTRPDSEPLRAVTLDDEAVEKWLRLERRRLLAPLNHLSGMAAGVMGERRTPGAYREQVEEYLDCAQKEIKTMVAVAAVDRSTETLDLQLENLSEENYENVVVEVDIAGEVSSFFDEYDIDDHHSVPEPPEPWGTGYRGHLLSLTTPYVPSLGGIGGRPRGSTRNTGSTHARFPAEHLRPRKRIRLDPLVVVIDARYAGTTIEARWSATSTNVGGTATGTIAIEVSDDPIALDDFLDESNRSEDD